MRALRRKQSTSSKCKTLFNFTLKMDVLQTRRRIHCKCLASTQDNNGVPVIVKQRDFSSPEEVQQLINNRELLPVAKSSEKVADSMSLTSRLFPSLARTCLCMFAAHSGHCCRWSAFLLQAGMPLARIKFFQYFPNNPSGLGACAHEVAEAFLIKFQNKWKWMECHPGRLVFMTALGECEDFINGSKMDAA